MPEEVASPEAPAATPAATLDDLVDRYIKLRDKKTELKGDYERKVAAVDQALERIEAFFMRHLDNSGSESVRTKAGTFFKAEQNSATVADWDSIWSWVQEDLEARAAILEKRVSKGFVQSYRDEHNDLPPGINWRTAYVVNVRRS